MAKTFNVHFEGAWVEMSIKEIAELMRENETRVEVAQPTFSVIPRDPRAPQNQRAKWIGDAKGETDGSPVMPLISEEAYKKLMVTLRTLQEERDSQAVKIAELERRCVDHVGEVESTRASMENQRQNISKALGSGTWTDWGDLARVVAVKVGECKAYKEEVINQRRTISEIQRLVKDASTVQLSEQTRTYLNRICQIVGMES